MTDTLGKNTPTTNKLSKNVSKQSWTSVDTSSDDGLSTKPVAHPPLSDKLSPSAKGLADSTQHTPGPWAIAYRHASAPKADYYNLCDSTGNLVCTLHRYGDKPFYDIAQLIAQAPSLLESLERALQFIQYNGPASHDSECGCNYCALVVETQAIIAKAKGGQV